jgi:hypothetical protein
MRQSLCIEVVKLLFSCGSQFEGPKDGSNVICVPLEIVKISGSRADKKYSFLLISHEQAILVLALFCY